MSGDDLELTLSGGETFTIAEYGTFSEAQQTFAFMADTFGDYEYMSNHLVLNEDAIEVPSDAAGYVIDDEGKHIFALDGEVERTIILTGGGNTLLATSTGEHSSTLSIAGDGSTVYSYNSRIHINGESNTIYANNDKSIEGNRLTITMGDNLLYNTVYAYGSNDFSSITTSRGGVTQVYAQNSYSVIDSYGIDTVNISGGIYANVNVKDEDNMKYIELKNSSHCNVIDVGNAEGVQVDYYYNQNNGTPNEILYSKSANQLWFSYNTDLYRGVDTYMTLSETRGSAILDNEDFANNTSLSIIGSAGNTVMSARLNEMTEYNVIGASDIDIDYWNENVTLGIAKKVLFESQDFSAANTYTCSPTAVTKPIEINDYSGNDTLICSESALGDSFRFFFDADMQSNVLGTDLYILSMSNGQNFEDSSLYNFISNNDQDVTCIRIENFFDGEGGHGAGYIETIKDSQGRICSTDNCINAVKNDIATWLVASETSGHHYDSAMDAITSGDDVSSLCYQYTTDESYSGITWNNYWA